MTNLKILKPTGLNVGMTATEIDEAIRGGTMICLYDNNNMYYPYGVDGDNFEFMDFTKNHYYLYVDSNGDIDLGE